MPDTSYITEICSTALFIISYEVLQHRALLVMNVWTCPHVHRSNVGQMSFLLDWVQSSPAKRLKGNELLRNEPSSLSLSLSLRFNGRFPGEPGLAGVYCLLKQRMMKVVVTTGAISRAKLQSNHHHQQTNIQFFYRPDALPVAQPTLSKH